MKKEIHLKDIGEHLHNCLIELNHNFIKDILIKSSGSKEPYKNEKFIRKLGLKFHKGAKRNTGFDYIWRNNRSIKFGLLLKIKKLSNISWIDIEKNIKSIRKGRHGGKISPNFPIKIDRKMGSTIGHILGDGSIGRYFLDVFYTNSNKDLIKEFYKNMRLIFGTKPRIWLQKQGRFKEQSKWIRRLKRVDKIPKGYQIGLFYPSMCGHILNSIFGDFCIGKNKRITPKIFDTPKDFQNGLIRSFFDDEGYVSRHRTMRFYQDNKNILNNLRKMLLNIGIRSSPIRSYIKNNKKRYYFGISSKINYLRFYSLIGCTSRNKSNNLKWLIDNTKIRLSN